MNATTTTPSPRYRLNAEDGLKILRGALLAAGGAALAYLSGEVLPNLDAGTAFGAALAAAAATALNALRKWLTGPA